MQILKSDTHGIPIKAVDRDALTVIDRLKQAGFVAHLVGGSVRDLLLGRSPKDYDITTSARPEEVKRVFGRQCLLIGKRFRLAHIRFKKKIIEVSTFRSGATGKDELIVRDNQYGTEEEDVLRRDFTINGLLFDPHEQTVIDYIGGYDDLKSGVIRCIGDPPVRFRQDPVRMLRLLKFKARLDHFSIDETTLNGLVECREEIEKSSPARILEELFRMLESGYAEPFMRLLAQHDFLKILLPCQDHFMQRSTGKEVYKLLAAADQLGRHLSHPALERALLFSCLLFPILEKEIEKQYLEKEVSPHMGQIISLAWSIVQGVIQSAFSHFPRRISSLMVSIMTDQYRLTPLTGHRTRKGRTLRHTDFHLALKMLKVRSVAHPELKEAYVDWKEAHFRHLNEERKKKA